MPLFGLAEASEAVPAAGYRSTARGRITGEEAETPVDAEGSLVEREQETPA